MYTMLTREYIDHINRYHQANRAFNSVEIGVYVLRAFLQQTVVIEVILDKGHQACLPSNQLTLNLIMDTKTDTAIPYT